MSGAPDAIMLFAAGFGTRMGPLTRDKPKPMIEVAGQPLIDHALALVSPLDIGTCVVNLHYKGDILAGHLAGRDIALSWETPDILDTGGGLKAALHLLGTDPVFTMNTDAIWSGPNPLEMLMRQWDPETMDALLACVPIGSTLGRSGGGDFSLTAAGEIGRGGDFVYGGAQIIRCGAVRDHPDDVFSLNAIWDGMASRNRLFGAVYPGRWCDVGHPEGIEVAETLLSEPHV
jgi:MurNAc alpha-1-phosphate uridylyltransferase